MKLEISFEDGRPVIVDDRGEQMPCVRSVRVDYEYRDVTTIKIVLIVDGDKVKIVGSDDGPVEGG